jgi:hypothetical protein
VIACDLSYYVKYIPKSNVKALAAATCSFGVRVVKDELALDFVVNEVHLRADHEHQRPLVDYNAYSSFLNDLIELADLVLLHIVHHI